MSPVANAPRSWQPSRTSWMRDLLGAVGRQRLSNQGSNGRFPEVVDACESSC